MERDIKPTYDELESYVENLQKQLADAQATIAALQAVIRQMGEQAAVLAKDGMAAKAQVAALQARAKELEDSTTKWQEVASLRTAGDAKFLREMEQLKIDLARVTAERNRLALCGHDHSTQWWQVRYEDLADLVAALPVVEGPTIYTGKNTNQVVITDKSGIIFGTLYGIENANAITALLRERQRMG